MRSLRLALISCVMASATTAATAAPLPSPIAQASSGMLQCYVPNPVTKSCQSSAAYQSAPDGGILNPSTVLLSRVPAITMLTVTPVTIKAGQVCGTLRAEDIAAATFTVDGAPASPTDTAQFRQQMAGAEQSILGKEICTAYLPVGDALLAKASVAGVAEPAMDQKVIWVSPADGYKVRP